jgi:cytochrome c-type biogenesis protein CcmF
MGGSLLFFSLGLAGAALVAAWRAPAPRAGLVAAAGGAVTAAVAGFVVVLSDPFDRLEIPAVDGAGLTPILEHPAMLYHPPLVYAGLTALLAPAALTVAALRAGPLDDAWRAQVRCWLLVPWTLLAIGMLAGAHWAYVELGWGGYWAWDPVENTALLPWLAVTAALHSLQRSATPDSSAPLIGSAFLLALLGGLLTRSGVTMSVHAFAEERAIGQAFALLLLVAVAGFAALVLWHRRRWPGLRARATSWPPSRDSALRLQQTLVLVALVAVLAGSVWPLAAELRGGRGLAVDGSFFAAVAGPVAVGLLLVLAVGPPLGRRLVAEVALVPVVGAAGGLALAALGGWHGLFALATAAAGGAALAGVGVDAARRGRNRPVGSHLAHLGVILLLVGVAGTTTGATETVSLGPDQSTDVHGRTVTNEGAAVVADPAPGTEAVAATILIDGHALRPELVVHTARRRVLAESALWSRPTEDVQVMLRDGRDDGGVVIQVGIHPLQQLVWWGGLLVTVGGGAGLWSALRRPGRDRRTGADAGSRAGTPASPRDAVSPPLAPLGAPGAAGSAARA